MALCDVLEGPLRRLPFGIPLRRLSYATNKELRLRYCRTLLRHYHYGR